MVLIHHEGSAGATSAQITKLANFAYTPDGIEPVHLYGSLDTDLDPKSRAAAAEDRASILDSVNERAHRLMGSLGPSDRRKIDEYLTAILRSNSAARRAAASSGLATGRGGFGTPGGRCNPAAPSLRYASRQRYSTLRLIWTSWCKALTLSPSSIRCATPSLNSLVKTRFFPDNLGPLPFNENCP